MNKELDINLVIELYQKKLTELQHENILLLAHLKKLSEGKDEEVK